MVHVIIKEVNILIITRKWTESDKWIFYVAGICLPTLELELAALGSHDIYSSTGNETACNIAKSFMWLQLILGHCYTLILLIAFSVSVITLNNVIFTSDPLVIW